MKSNLSYFNIFRTILFLNSNEIISIRVFNTNNLSIHYIIIVKAEFTTYLIVIIIYLLRNILCLSKI
jgi:hypothetical protein